MQGQLIEKSGTMTGGGNKIFKGLMSDRIIESGVTIEQLKDLEQRLQGLQERMNNIRTQIRNISNELRNCNKCLEKAKINNRKLNMELNGLGQRKEGLEEQVPEIEAAAEMNDDDQDNMQELEEEKKEKHEEFLIAQHNSELIEDKIRDLEEEILNAGGNNLREQKNKVDAMKKKLKDKQKLVTKLKVEIKTCQKKLKTSTNKFESMESNLDEMKAEYAEIKTKIDELEDKAAEVMALSEKKKELFEEKEVEWKELSKKVEKNNAKITALTKSILTEKENKKTAEHECRNSKSRIKKIKSEWLQLRKKYAKNKNDFLEEDEEEEGNENDETEDEEMKNNHNKNNQDENENENENAMDVDTENDGNETEKEKEKEKENENKNDSMDVDDETDGERKENSQQSQQMEVEINIEVYFNEQTLKFEMLPGAQLSEVDLSKIDEEIDEIKHILQRSKVNMGAIEAYRKKDGEYVTRLRDLQSCKKRRDEIRKKYEDFKKARFDSFMHGFNLITKKLKEMYRMLTCGGDAELELVDSIDPFSEGVQFSVRPPKKSWKNISNLSGGEKTLSSMALVFALHHFKPTPLYVMDEIDAALDFKNVSIVANYIHKRTKNAQFIIISLRNNMFELANRLVGIYKTNNASKSITIDPKLFKLPDANNANKQQQPTNLRNNINNQNNQNNQNNHNHNKQQQQLPPQQQHTQNNNSSNNNNKVIQNQNETEDDIDDDDDDDDILLDKPIIIRTNEQNQSVVHETLQ